MAQTKIQIRSLLEQAQIEPRRRFGQNFMIDQNAVRLVADAGQITRDDLVLEVGPGTGTLTEELLARAWRVVAVEIDRDLIKILRERFVGENKLMLIEADALTSKHSVNPQLLRACQLIDSISLDTPVKLVANLPYNIASPLIIELLVAGVNMLAFTVQREVGERLRAPAGDDAYGPLSIMAQTMARVEMLRILPPQIFWPAPGVESALMRLTREDRLGPRSADFSRFIHQIFSFRRKTLRAAFRHAGLDPTVLDAMRVDPQLRPENLTPEQFLRLYDAMVTRRK
jgi:16S rRNA (adenine1518-N6/adenine1519-N6)-dimethyltransferase